MIKNNLLLPFLLLFLASAGTNAWGQTKYWVYFKTKAPREEGIPYVSEKTQHNRGLLGLEQNQFSDLPVDPASIAALAQQGIRPVCLSKWLNAVTAYLDDRALERVLSMDDVKGVSPIYISSDVSSIATLENEDWTIAFKQINAMSVVREKFDGSGVDVGIIDGGFRGADVEPSLRHLSANGNVKATRDFVEPTNASVFHSNHYEVSAHGTRVWKMIAGIDKENKVQYGVAINSNFYLARTDNADREYRGEEDFWIAALEWLDSTGVRLVNTSLGYSVDFDDPADNYKPSQMDGVTTAIAKAADMAVREKGMIIIKSTGNDGENPDWRVLSTPGDAKHVICVGATDNDHWIKPEFSGIGPEFLPYIKPNMACATPGGTSYSAPVIAGLVACMLQLKSNLTSKEVQDILERSSHLYPYGNNYIGFGVPDAEKILSLMHKGDAGRKKYKTIRVKENSFTVDLEKYGAEYVTVFFKKDKYHVVSQDVLKEKKNVIIRSPGITHTTIVFKNEVTELEWK